MIFINQYHCRMYTKQQPVEENEDPMWKYIIEYNGVATDENTKVAIPSIHGYASPFDALQDAYGIMELMGFRLNKDYPLMPVEVISYGDNNKELIDLYSYDGSDFHLLSASDENESD